MLRRLILLWPACVGAAYLWSALCGPPEVSEAVAAAPDSRAEPGSASPGSAQPARSFAAMREAPPLSAEERFVKAELEYQLRSGTRADRVVMTDGREMQGRVVAQSPRSVQLLRSFGDSGEMEVTLHRAEIARIERVERDAPSISDRDVRFRMEFPDFNLYRRPPFTIMTNQRFLEVEDAVAMLEELNGDLVRVVWPLVGDAERRDGIQILFFSDEAKFAEYRDAFAPSLGYASGFYSPMKDRLVIFDQANSEWAQSAAEEIRQEFDRYAEPARSRGAADRVHHWHTRARRSLNGAAAHANRVVLRHEGAHQLLHAYGVHSERGAEHLWLIEGLASYFETRGGEENRGRVAELRAGRRRAIPFRELVNYSSRLGLGGLGGEQRVSLAYAQSWLIVRTLMRDDPDKFFEYVRFVADPANEDALRSRTRFEILTRFAGADLERRLVSALRQI